MLNTNASTTASTFTAKFAAEVALRSEKLGGLFSKEELEVLVGIWEAYLVSDDEFDPEAVFEVVAEAVGDDRCEAACMVLEWA